MKNRLEPIINYPSPLKLAIVLMSFVSCAPRAEFTQTVGVNGSLNPILRVPNNLEYKCANDEKKFTGLVFQIPDQNNVSSLVLQLNRYHLYYLEVLNGKATQPPYDPKFSLWIKSACFKYLPVTTAFNIPAATQILEGYLDGTWFQHTYNGKSNFTGVLLSASSNLPSGNGTNTWLGVVERKTLSVTK
jgi:hypothetical protein